MVSTFLLDVDMEWVYLGRVSGNCRCCPSECDGCRGRGCTLDYCKCCQVEDPDYEGFGVVVLSSGGIDSTVAAYHYTRALGRPVELLAVQYGQPHYVELGCARRVSEDLGVELRVTAISPSSAVWPGRMGLRGEESVVPGRNLVLLSLGAAAAQSRGMTGVVLGATATDEGLYPDCREGFLHLAGQAIHVAYGVQVVAPFLEMSKAAVVKYGHGLGVPFERTWSCYAGRVLHCGVCGACLERRKAFLESGVLDPTVYE